MNLPPSRRAALRAASDQFARYLDDRLNATPCQSPGCSYRGKLKARGLCARCYQRRRWWAKRDAGMPGVELCRVCGELGPANRAGRHIRHNIEPYGLVCVACASSIYAGDRDKGSSGKGGRGISYRVMGLRRYKSGRSVRRPWNPPED